MRGVLARAYAVKIDIRAPRRRYGAILADPPWKFETWSEKGKGRSPERHYECLSVAEIMALPVADLAASDCVLFLWTTWPHLPNALETIKAWGFSYKTDAFLWVKMKNGAPSIGTGYWTRANSECCLLATRGKPKRRKRDVPQVILEPRREHSRKPESARERIERLVDGPYVELFARSQRPGWDAWGNQINHFKKRR